MEDLMKLKLDSNRIFLDGTEIKGLKSYEVKVSAEELSILNMTLYVDTFGDKEEQDISNKKRDKPSVEVGIKVDSKELDEAIEKAKQLTELLGEAQKIVDSLSNKRCTSDKDRVLEAFILASKEIIEEEKARCVCNK